MTYITDKQCESGIRNFESECKKNGLALTVQRREIYAALACRKDHPTADQVYEDIKTKLKGVSRTTVYRVLDTLVTIGVAKRISIPDSKARFDGDMKRHHHLTCMKCGTVFDLHDESLNNLQTMLDNGAGFEIMDYSITFTGLCSRCRNSRTYPATER
ncbi:MAG: transcriptional repressor [Geobacteraceae bacterium]|nr:transcriptional repressor [Geobacteraceae bacterium]